MNLSRAEETERLKRSWDRHSAEMLTDYMVAECHDPRINPQSIHGRHFLIEALFGDQFLELQTEEFRFATVMPWALALLKEPHDPDELAAIEHALARGDDNAEGESLPYHVRQTFRLLPRTVNGLTIDNYLAQALKAAAEPEAQRRAGQMEQLLDTFASAWRDTLNPRLPSVPALSVLEPACGSANDYRAIARFGLARHVKYSGFDLCETNVANARTLFPDGEFSVGNIFAIDHPDKSFDYTVVHDLFEHFSEEGLEVALAELCRVTRRGFFIGFFQLHEGPDHVIRPVNEYHWNTLSLPRVRASLERHHASVQAMHVNTFLRWQLGCGESIYYDTAYSLCGRFIRDAPPRVETR